MPTRKAPVLRRIRHNSCTTRLHPPLRRLLNFSRLAEVKTALVPRRLQGDGYSKSIREIGTIRGYLFDDELGEF